MIVDCECACRRRTTQDTFSVFVYDFFLVCRSVYFGLIFRKQKTRRNAFYTSYGKLAGWLASRKHFNWIRVHNRWSMASPKRREKRILFLFLRSALVGEFHLHCVCIAQRNGPQLNGTISSSIKRNFYFFLSSSTALVVWVCSVAAQKDDPSMQLVSTFAAFFFA